MEPSPGTPKKRALIGEVANATSEVSSSAPKKRRAEGNKDQTSSRKKREVSRKECIVCMADVAKNQFPKLPHSASTTVEHEHDSQVCFKCWQDHVKSEVESNMFEAVACLQCSKLLDESEVRKLASSFIHQDYIAKGLKQYLQSEEEYHACPKSDCSWGAFFAKGDGNILVCPMCHTRHCILCDVPFHEGQTCEKFQEARRRAIEEEGLAAKRRQEEEQASANAVKKVSRPCPKCGVNIDKYAGCDHVTCRQCRHEFCWRCFAHYRGDGGIFVVGNSAHKDSCRYSTRRLTGTGF